MYCIVLFKEDDSKLLTISRWFLFLTTANQSVSYANTNFYFTAQVQLCLVFFIIIIVLFVCFSFSSSEMNCQKVYWANIQYIQRFNWIVRLIWRGMVGNVMWNVWRKWQKNMRFIKSFIFMRNFIQHWSILSLLFSYFPFSFDLSFFNLFSCEWADTHFHFSASLL